VSDPVFPSRLLSSREPSTLDFVQYLFEGYSKRGLTNQTDKMAAISGIETRIARAFNCQIYYGIVGQFFCKTLLWQREAERLKKIDYGNKRVPSWSWMSYDGAIKFMIEPSDTIDSAIALGFYQNRRGCLNVEVADFWEFSLKEHDTEYEVLDLQGQKVGTIYYDTDDIIQSPQCVIVGRSPRSDEMYRYFILVVKPTLVQSEYERIGCGNIGSSHISRISGRVRLV